MGSNQQLQEALFCDGGTVGDKTQKGRDPKHLARYWEEVEGLLTQLGAAKSRASDEGGNTRGGQAPVSATCRDNYLTHWRRKPEYRQLVLLPIEHDARLSLSHIGDLGGAGDHRLASAAETPVIGEGEGKVCFSQEKIPFEDR